MLAVSTMAHPVQFLHFMPHSCRATSGVYSGSEWCWDR